MKKKPREPEPWGGRPGASFGPGRSGYAAGPPAVLPSYARGPAPIAAPPVADDPRAGSAVAAIEPRLAPPATPPTTPTRPPLEQLPLSAGALGALRTTVMPLLATSAILTLGGVVVLSIAALVAASTMGAALVVVALLMAAALSLAAVISAAQVASAATALGRIAAGDGVAQAHLVRALGRLANVLTVRAVLVVVVPPLACGALFLGYLVALFLAIGQLHG